MNGLEFCETAHLVIDGTHRLLSRSLLLHYRIDRYLRVFPFFAPFFLELSRCISSPTPVTPLFVYFPLTVMQSLTQPASSLDEALNVYRTSTSGWENATDYFYNSTTHRPSLHKVADPGIQLNSVQPLPSTFVTQYNNVKYKSFMGLFPQINRAWLTVDSKLFLWAYSPFQGPPSPNDFYVYEGFSQIIVSVALVPPIPTVFVDSVKYLVAVATPVEVTLLGVTFSQAGELSLVPTHISVATDNILMLKILSTPSGRIFMAGADGTLHEFEYEARPHSNLLDLISGRPAKRARKIAYSGASFASYFVPNAVKAFFARSDEIVDLVVDSDALYTLSVEGLLSVYDVSKGARCVSTVNVKQDVRSMTFSLPASDREFVSIHAVPAEVSDSVQLIVVTSFGERIYYTTQTRYSDSSSPRASRPRTLRFVSFRGCPDQDPRQSRPCVHIAWCERGAAIFADLRENDNDRLIAVYPDSTIASQAPANQQFQAGSMKTAEVVFEKSLGEHGLTGFNGSVSLATPMTQSTARTNGYGANGTTSYGPKRTFAIAEAGPSHRDEEEGTPIESPNFFWVLTPTAMHLYERVQPSSRLHEIFSSGGGSSLEIEEFFRRYGSAEACAMCLEIAISQPQLSTAAAKVFYTYGGKPISERRQSEQEAGSRSMSDSHGRRSDMAIETRNGSSGQTAFDVGRPSAPAVPLARFSGAHDGTAWYLAKVVHPVWTKHITSDRNPEAYQRLSTSKDGLARVRDRLLAVVSFLEKYTPEAMLPDATSSDARHRMMNGHGSDSRRESSRYRIGGDPTTDSGDDEESSAKVRLFRGLYQLKRTSEARRAEASSITALKRLAERTIEALALLLILSDHQLHRLVVSLPKETRGLLVQVRLCDLVVAEVGTVVSAALIEAIFSSYRDGTAAVSNVGRMLQERCSSYFGDSDVELHRGLAILRQAVETAAGASNVASGRSVLLNGDYDVRAGLLTPNSGAASGWEAAMNLAQEAARIIKNVPARVFDIAAVCEDFKTVGATPLLVDVALTIGKAAEGGGNEGRAKTAYDCIFEALRPFFEGLDGMVSSEHIEDRDRLREATMRVALGSDSDLFLRRFYEFLMGSDQGREELLREKSAKVESFLQEKGARDVLWRYFAKHGRHLEAAVVLQELAEKEGPAQLVDRLNYLSCALHNAKMASSKGDGRAASVLTEVTDYMEVAKVQLRVREELTRRHNATEEVKKAAKELDSEIMDLSALFNEYARPFDLYEASLSIFRCGGYRDEKYVQGLWTGIIEREAETSVTPALVSQRIESLGREFYPSDVAFPTSYIIDLLERLVVRNSDIAGWGGLENWVCDTMESIGVPLANIVAGYRRTIENPQTGDNEWSWSDESLQMHLLKATGRVIEKWLGQMAGREGNVLSEADKALRAIGLCKSRLRGMSCAGVEVLVERFEALERKVSPLVHNTGY